MAHVDYKRELGDLITILVSENASDIHFSVGDQVEEGERLITLTPVD